MSAKTLSLITGNTEKFEGFKSMLGPDFSYDAVKQDINVPEYQGAPQEICKAKCEAAARILKAPVVIIDNALCINAWGGLPGSSLLGLFGTLKLALALQFIVTNTYFSVACNTKVSVGATLK